MAAKLSDANAWKQSETLARALQAEFGGRRKVERTAGEFSSYFTVQTRVDGLGECWIAVRPDGWQLSCVEFSLGRPDRPGSKTPWLLINRTKAVDYTWGDKGVLAPGSFANPNLRVLRGREMTASDAKRFCRTHERTIEELQLRPGEYIFFGGRLALRCAGADMALARARVELLRRFHAGARAESVPERAIFAREFRLAAANRGPHRFGGVGVAPICSDCGAAAQLVAELDLNDGVLPKAKLRRKSWPVFWCFECAEWEPRYHDVSGKTITTLSPRGRPLAAVVGSAPPALRERRMALRASAVGKTNSTGSKVGGAPAWVQTSAVPACVRCKEPMSFMLQLASDRKINFEDRGTLYSFASLDCHVSATLLQSH
jgi:hypothetical protein